MRFLSSVFVGALLIAGSLGFSTFASDDPKPGSNPIVEMKTSMGTIKIELFQDKAPISAKNFLSYVDEKYYDGTVFHRVIETFMIQGGGFDNSDPIRQKRTKSPIKNEANNGLKNERGTLAMARTGDPDSATSQFFINVVDNDGLNRPKPDGHGYAVFGKVIEGMDVVDKIKKVKTGTATVIARGPGDREIRDMSKDVPQTKVVIESVRRVEKKAESKTQSK
jgi:peptidyl-prolyl cis-trans isomerase A (cyclophilin A)